MIKGNQEPKKFLKECDICGMEYEFDISDEKLIFNYEYLSYNNFHLPPCTACGNVEVLNMNLPEDTPEMIEQMPNKEKTNRSFVRQIKEVLLEK